MCAPPLASDGLDSGVCCCCCWSSCMSLASEGDAGPSSSTLRLPSTDDGERTPRPVPADASAGLSLPSASGSGSSVRVAVAAGADDASASSRDGTSAR